LGAKLRISEDKTKNINIFIGLIIEPGDFNLKGSGIKARGKSDLSFVEREYLRRSQSVRRSEGEGKKVKIMHYKL